MKIFVFMPHRLREPVSHYFTREGGLLSLGFRSIGVESKFVLIGEVKEYGDYPLISAPEQDLCSPAWWRALEIDGVVMWSWFNVAHMPFASAIKEAGVKLFMRTDSNNGPINTFSVMRDYYGDLIHKPNFYGLARALYHHLLPFYGDKLIRYLSCGDIVSIEAPLSLDALRRFYRSRQREDLVRRSVFCPSPVTEDCVYDVRTEKRDSIISVGRWDAFQKNAPFLVRVLTEALARHREYRADIIGSGDGMLERLLVGTPADVRSRIGIHRNVSHQAVVRHYQRAKIFFIPSRFESSCNAAEEALSCGCSLAGPARVASFNYYVSRQSGSVSANYSVKGLLGALEEEILAWRDGKRDPAASASSWQKEFRFDNVARQTLELLSQK